MAKHPNDDLFEGSTMSFGEHLEELRVTLFRALIGLLIGFLLGLLVANYVVDWIQTPLKGALEKYYLDKTVDELKKDYGEAVTTELEQFIREKGFVFDKVYLERDEVLRMTQLIDADQQQEEERAIALAATPANSPDNSDNSDNSDKQEGGKQAGKQQAGDGNSAGAGNSASAGEAVKGRPIEVLGGDSIPAPGSVLLLSRVWRPIDMLVKSLSAQEVFMIWLKAAFISGLVIASPWIFWHIWAFVAAGLFPHEKRMVYFFLPVSMLLFLSGVGMAFFFVFEPVLNFLFSFNKRMNIDPDPRISEWLSFVLFLPLGFGIAFQLPLVMLFLNRIGIFTIAVYLEKWRIAILIIFVIAMVLTPADPISMLMLAVPLTVLYFLGIGLCRWLPANRNPFDEAYEP